MYLCIVKFRNAGFRLNYMQPAIFIHCYFHKVNLVMKNSPDNVTESKILFSTSSGLPSFSFKIIQMNAYTSPWNVLLVTTTWWKYSSDYCNRTHDWHHKSLHLNGWKWISGTVEVVCWGDKVSATFQDFDFKYLLCLFCSILPLMESKFKILQKNIFSSVFVQNK